MGFIKFVFVLLIIIPVAVFMIYLINNLNEKLRENIRNAEKEDKNMERPVERNRDKRRAVYGKGSPHEKVPRHAERPERRHNPSYPKAKSRNSHLQKGENDVASRQYDRASVNRGAQLGGSFGMEIPDKDRYKQDSPYYINKRLHETERSLKEEKNMDKGSRNIRKKRRKKKEKNKKKDREQ